MMEGRKNAEGSTGNRTEGRGSLELLLEGASENGHRLVNVTMRSEVREVLGHEAGMVCILENRYQNKKTDIVLVRKLYLKHFSLFH